MLAAARALLEQEGPAAVTHQRVAARAGVGRATVYRHWAEPATLLRDAMAQVDLPFFTDYSAGLHEWLRRELRRLSDELALQTVRQSTVALIQSAQRDPAARQQLDRWLDLTAQRLHQALAAAAANGEVDPPAAVADQADLAARLLGPLVYRTILRGATVSDALLDNLVLTVAPSSAQHELSRALPGPPERGA